MRRVVVTLMALATLSGSFAAVVPGWVGSAVAQTAPVCPAGSTFNPATGGCEVPATVTCPAGMTPVAATCTATVECPLEFGVERAIVSNPIGGVGATCVGFATIVGILCPAGTVTSFVPGVINIGPSGSITCTAPATIECPAGFAPVGATCTAPATFTGFGGEGGDAIADGGDSGSARGGDGGRGGSGTAPVCNQNTNDTIWNDEPTVWCGAGAAGGEAGDGGISDGGDGGFAFAVD